LIISSGLTLGIWPWAKQGRESLYLAGKEGKTFWKKAHGPIIKKYKKMFLGNKKRKAQDRKQGREAQSLLYEASS